MVSDQFKCIFVEVPKTGSTSIRSIIGAPKVPHMNIAQIARTVTRETFKSYFKFGFVRNPWDRAVSLYERKEGLQVRERMSFEDFIDWMKMSSSTCLYPLPHRYQLDWFLDANGNIMVDYIGRFEKLQECWTSIAAKLGVPPELPHAKLNPRAKHYTEYYNDRTRGIVAERFAVDIEFFGYSFEG